MVSVRKSLVVLGLLAVTAEARAEDKASADLRAARALAAKIDELIAAKWKEKGVKPGRPADDMEFVRRVYLDLGGRIPKVSEVLDFKDLPLPQREYVVNELLGLHDSNPRFVDRGQMFANHFATIYAQLLVAPTGDVFFGGRFGNGMEVWLKQQFAKPKVHYDRMVREILSGPINGQAQSLFFQSRQFKPDDVAAATSRLFMGVKLECAQCHDHPFARWTRDQFWENAAFFAGLSNQMNPRMGGNRGESNVAEIAIPGKDRTVKARFLDGSEPDLQTDTSPRSVLANWLTRADNPFFARAAANRMWAHFFGVGLVDPVDDLHDQNPASHPELLDELAQGLADHDFDLKFLARAIVLSKTYQMSSSIDEADMQNPEVRDVDPRLFTRMALKGLSPEQLFDSIVTAVGNDRFAQNPNNQFGRVSPRQDFVQRFALQEKRTEYQTSILQALTMMNSSFVNEITAIENNKTLQKIANEPLDTAQRVEAIFLAVFNRKPTTAESEKLVKYVDEGGPKKDMRAALGDVFWALINSGEFILNR